MTDSDALSTPTPLADLVDYQPGSVVSRVIARSPGGVVTLFAFDDGEGLSAHSTPHEAMVQIVEGTAVIDIEGVTHTVESGQALRLPPSIPHTVAGEGRFKMMLTLLKTPEA